MYKYPMLLFLSLLLTACFGDKTAIIGQELGDDSFVNIVYKGNKKDFSALPQNLCEFLSEGQIMQFYPDSRKVTFDKGKRYVNKNCNFSIQISDKASDYLLGTIIAQEDPSIAGGSEWIESWETQKKLSKTAESVANLGKAAIWFPKKRTLNIKLDGYALYITVPGTDFQGKVITKLNGSLKEIAIQLAQETGLL